MELSSTEVVFLNVLFTTAVGETPDYLETITQRRFFGLRAKVPPSGIRFIKENVPEIETLEYPSWKKFKERLKEGWDILGISFYLKDIPIVEKMIKMARKQGIEEIWGGNYGILTDGIREKFDRAFVGYSEREIGEELGVEVNEIKHPEILTSVSTPLSLKVWKVGLLYTSRGCKMNCSFCQTPSFASGIETVPLESIEEVLKRYKKRGAQHVFIPDENFFINKKHSEKVIEILDDLGLYWGCLTRADFLDGRIKELNERGLGAVEIGIESLSQPLLDDIEKGLNAEKTIRIIEKLREESMYVVGTHMIGYPNQTEKDIREEIERLCSLDLTACQINILTPLPKTPLWEKLSEYGPFDPDYSKYNCMNLVWNHPNISQEKMKSLLLEAYDKFYSRKRYLRNVLPRILPFSLPKSLLKKLEE